MPDQPVQSIVVTSNGGDPAHLLWGSVSQASSIFDGISQTEQLPEWTPELKAAANSFAAQLRGWMQDQSQATGGRQFWVQLDLEQTRGDDLRFDRVLQQFSEDFKDDASEISTLEKTLRARLEEMFPNSSEQSIKAKLDNAVEQTVKFLGWEILNDIRRERAAAAPPASQSNTELTSGGMLTPPTANNSITCRECNFTFASPAVKVVHDQKVHKYGTQRYVCNICLQLVLQGGLPVESLRTLERLIAAIEARYPLTMFIQIQTEVQPNMANRWKWIYQNQTISHGLRASLGDLDHCWEALLHWIGQPTNWLNDVAVADQLRRLDSQFPHFFVLRDQWTIHQIRWVLCQVMATRPNDFNWPWLHNHLQWSPPPDILEDGETQPFWQRPNQAPFYLLLPQELQLTYTAKGLLDAKASRAVVDFLQTVIPEQSRPAKVLVQPEQVEALQKSLAKKLPGVDFVARSAEKGLRLRPATPSITDQGFNAPSRSQQQP